MLKYVCPDSWLLETARKFNLQNKLGFVVRVARRAAETRSDKTKSQELVQLDNLLQEDFLYRPPHVPRANEIGCVKIARPMRRIGIH